MKKTLIILAVLLCAFGVFAEEYTSSKGTTEGYDPNKTVEFTMQTSKANSVVYVGTPDKTIVKNSVLITSFGQCTETSMVNTGMKRIKSKPTYTYNPTAKASEVATYKTVIIQVGFSSKGLGSAGISTEDELARCKEIVETIKKNNINVIFVHIGGSARRTGNSETLIDMLLPYAKYIILKEDANYDYKFTDYAKANNVPIALLYGTKDIVSVLTDLYN